jgi:hypothetical protein
VARLQARLNVGRLNATRLGDYHPAVTIHISSTQAYRPGGIQGIVVDPSLTISEAEGDVPSTASFEVRDASSPPQQGQAVYIGLGSSDHRIFGGQIVRVGQTQSRYIEQPIWHVECEDYHRLMDRRLVSDRFLSEDAGDIIRTIVNSYTSGFTANHIQSGMGTVDEIEFTKEHPSKAITRVLNRVGGRWRLDPYRDVHAFVGQEGGVAEAAPITSSATVSKHWNWRHERDVTQARTKIYVHGFGTAAAAGDAILFPDGSSLAFGYAAGDTDLFVYGELTQIVATNTISINHGTQVTTVTANPALQYYEVTLVNNGLFSVNSQLASQVFVSPVLTRDVLHGNAITLVAIAQSTTYQNSIAAVEGGDGVHEYAITDGRLTQDGAIQRAHAELTIYGPIEQKGTYTTRDPNATTGNLVAVNVESPTHVSSVQAKIQRVTVSKFEESSRSWNTNRAHLFPQRKVTYSSGAVRDLYQILGDFERTGG